MRSRVWVWIIAGFIGLGLVAALGLPRLRPHTFHGTFIQSPEVAPDFTLISHTGQRASLSDFRGKWVFLYFGYTFCPDVCPATLAEVNQALALIGSKAEQVQVLMITVDPERDTAAKLTNTWAILDCIFWV
jgi:protein SCO1/2